MNRFGKRHRTLEIRFVSNYTDWDAIAMRLPLKRKITIFQQKREEASMKQGDLWVIKNYIKTMLIAAENGLERMDFEPEPLESRINQQFNKVYQSALEALTFIDGLQHGTAENED